MERLVDFVRKVFVSDAPAPQSEKAACQPVKMPVFALLFRPFGLFVDNTRAYFAAAGVYALILTALSYAGGQSYMCLYSDYREAGGYCTDNTLLFAFIHFLYFAVISAFMVRWYNICFMGQPLSLKYLCRPQLRDAQSLVVNLIFLLLNLCAVLSMYLLYVRVPNPDWRIEICYFAVVSLGFLLPFVLLRFYSVVAFVLGGEKVPPLSQVWCRSAGNTLRILLSLGLIFFFAVFSLFAFWNNFKLVDNKNAFYIGLVVEYLYNLLFLLLVTFFTNHCRLQKTFLFGRENDGE